MAIIDDSTQSPPITDRETWRRERDALLPREKAHTREGDVIAAARRRLPMTELPNVLVEGASGAVPLLELFDGRQQLVIYKHMWHAGQPTEGQCEGCTATIWDFHDASYLNARGVSFAVVSDGPWSELEPFRAFMGYTHPWFSVAGIDDEVLGREMGMFLSLLRQGDRIYLTYDTTDRGAEVGMTSAHLLDRTVYGRQEAWEDSPEGWPQDPTFTGWRKDGRPVPQWTRPDATPVAAGEQHHH